MERNLPQMVFFAKNDCNRSQYRKLEKKKKKKMVAIIILICIWLTIGQCYTDPKSIFVVSNTVLPLIEFNFSAFMLTIGTIAISLSSNSGVSMSSPPLVRGLDDDEIYP